jgi:lysozyme
MRSPKACNRAQSPAVIGFLTIANTCTYTFLVMTTRLFFGLLLLLAPVMTALAMPPRPSGDPNLNVCQRDKTLPGADISEYDPSVDWPVVGEGNGFTIIKATEGVTFADVYFPVYWAAAKATGLIRGAYHFFHADDDPVEQAKWFLSTVGPMGPHDLPPVLDWEVTDNMDIPTQIRRAHTWLRIVEEKTGKVPIIYVDPDFFNALGNPKEFAHYHLWIANWQVTCPDIPPPWSDWTFWQTGIGSVAGISDQTDMDLFNGSRRELRRFVDRGGWRPWLPLTSQESSGTP